MLRRLAVIIPCFLISVCVLAYDIEGTVYGFEGEPLADATIRLITAQRIEVGRTFTNHNGFYKIRDIAGGTYTMEISKMGMRSVSQEVMIGGPHYRSTVYRDINLSDLPRFESIRSSDLAALFLPDDKQIPMNAFSNYRRGLRHLERQNHRRALRSFNRAVSQYPEFSRCYTHIGHIYFLSGEIEQAEKNFSKAITLNPQDPIPLTYFSRLLVQQGRHSTAIPYLEKAVELDSGRAENYFLLGEAQHHTGNSGTAERTFLQGLMIAPRQAGTARMILADIYYDQNRYSEAKDMLHAYLRDNPFSENRSAVQNRIREIDVTISRIETVPDSD